MGDINLGSVRSSSKLNVKDLPIYMYQVYIRN